MLELSTEYAELYDELLETVAVAPRVTPDVLTSFWPLSGHSFDGDLMVIGRAAPGWHRAWDRNDLTNPKARQDVIRRSRSHSEAKKSCPLLWVALREGDPHFNKRGANFWRLVHRITLDGNRDENRAENWPSWLCYSNLLKIAPEALEEAPSTFLRRAQLPHCIQLLQRELAEWKPRRILVLTGKDWFAPFGEALGVNMRWREGAVQGVGTLPDQRWVIAKTPVASQDDVMVDEIIDGFAGRLIAS